MIGKDFTSAYRQSNYFDSDHAEAYPGQWHVSKTIGSTTRGVRHKGETGARAGGVGRAGVSREGRLTVSRHLGPSKPHVSTGISSNAGLLGSSSNPTNGPHHRAPNGRWTNPDRGRQLPITLVDEKTKQGVKPNYFEPTVYSKDLSDTHLRYDSMCAYTSKAQVHQDYAWNRSPGTMLRGSPTIPAP